MPKSAKKKAESPPKDSSDGSAQPKRAKKSKKPTMKEIFDAEQAIYTANLAEFQRLDAKPSPLNDDDYVKWVELNPDITMARKKRMIADRMALIESRKKAGTPAKPSNMAVGSKSSAGSKIVGIAKSTQKEIAQKIEKLETHRKGSGHSVSSGRPPTAQKKKGPGRPRKLTTGDKLFHEFL